MEEDKEIIDSNTNLLVHIVKTTKKFINESSSFLEEATKPKSEELSTMISTCIIGMVGMGMIGFMVKLVFIPINNIILGSIRV